MPYEAELDIRQGSVRALYAEATAPVGGTVQVQPGATFTLYREDGTAAPGLNAAAVSGYETGPQREARVWYLLNSSTLAAGVYSGLFSFHAVGSDGIDRTLAVDLRIRIQPAIEVSASYDESALMTSPLYQTRLHAGDTDMVNPIWSDAEINYLLSASGGFPQLAASLALEALALDRAKLANAVRIGAFGSGEAETYKAIAERAKRLRALAVVPVTVSPPTRVFVPETNHGREPGTMENW